MLFLFYTEFLSALNTLLPHYLQGETLFCSCQEHSSPRLQTAGEISATLLMQSHRHSLQEAGHPFGSGVLLQDSR